jgi:uncharacterized membrane protein
MIKEITAIFLSLLPISELRGGILYSAVVGFSPLKAFFICTLANLLVSPLVFLFLSILHNFLIKFEAYEKFFAKTIKRLNKKTKQYERKHKVLGYFALSLFTAIPLPYTGSYTTSLIAWILGLNKVKSIVAISIGIIIAGILVTISVYGIKILFFGLRI